MSVTVNGNGGIIEVKASGSVVIDGGTRIDINQNVYNTNVYGDTPTIEIKGGSQNNIIDINNKIDIFKCGNFLYTPPAPFDEFKTMLTVRFLAPIDTEFTPGQSKNIVLEINEVGGLATSANIVIRLSKAAGFTISYDPSLIFSDTPKTFVNNSTMNVDFLALTFDTQMTITDILPALETKRLSFTITANQNALPGSQANFTASLLFGTGGSVKVDNDATRLYII